ncbi:MAG: hypothetical protein HRU49_05315 [Winogradskyella sp.]|uniref:hypothetical protein n=1 Tax=Winogradskyella sp. TaxID=1883156 RepID=UPI0025D9B200|nr:hypothetical protein [Winogradskyella sp.]NRB83178.1 hypothetical protein [Winogradskyella sp.]
MRSKLHIGIIIILLALVNRFVNQPVIPNQQIVIAFSEAQAANNDASQTLESIQSKLESIGVYDIQIHETLNGQYRITYHSTSHVDQVKKLLSDANYELSHKSENQENKLPKEGSNKLVQLDVLEITKVDSKNDWDFDGVQIAEYNPKSDRFNHIKFNFSGRKSSSEKTTLMANLGLKLYRYRFTYIDCNVYNIPEVRAGPLV